MFSGFGAKLIAFGGILLGIALAFWKIIRMGKRLEQAEQMEETLDAVKEKNALDHELDDPDARKRLREKHSRD